MGTGRKKRLQKSNIFQQLVFSKSGSEILQFFSLLCDVCIGGGPEPESPVLILALELTCSHFPTLGLGAPL